MHAATLSVPANDRQQTNSQTRTACLLTIPVTPARRHESAPQRKRNGPECSNADATLVADNVYGIKPRITNIDRVIIRNYFRQADCIPSLPPRHLPRQLECKLSPLPAGYQRVTVGGGVVLVDTNVSRMVDILRWHDGA
jgi:hypothetical protein